MVENDCNMDLTTLEGARLYRNTLQFIILKVLHEMFPENKSKIEYSINKGSFGTVEGIRITTKDIKKIRQRIQYYIDKDLEIEEIYCTKSCAIKLLEENGMSDTAEDLKFNNSRKILMYKLNSFISVFYSKLAKNTGCVSLFDIQAYDPGFIFFYPTRHKPNELPLFTEQKKLSAVFGEFNKWGEILGVSDVANLNKIVKQGLIDDIILASEALQDVKLGEIANEISDRKSRFIMISGPSSSGKTTFANRLKIHLLIHGIKAKIISLDNYYIDRDKMIPDENGEYDLESIDALDVDYFKKNLTALAEEGYAEIPEFDFTTASRKPELMPLELKEDELLIIEGIHGLNPLMTKGIRTDSIYKVYISALTTINMDSHNKISTTDTRLIRRITRDFKYRNSTASRTLNMWASVRLGEDKYIFPFQEEADVIFNSALIYEHGIIRTVAEPVLKKVPKDDPGYSEARRLLDILYSFERINSDAVPPSSIIREFIGGSCFEQ